VIALFTYVYSEKKDRDKHKKEDTENKEKGLVKQDENPEKQGEDSHDHKCEACRLYIETVHLACLAHLTSLARLTCLTRQAHL
jgi:hypothetical protein